MNNTIDFNINEYIYVKITKAGHAILRKNHEELFKDFKGIKECLYKPPVEDSEGYSRWQAWVFMNSLGAHIIMGTPIVCSPGIKIEIKEITEKKLLNKFEQAHADVVAHYEKREVKL